MLILTRRTGEALIIGDGEVTVTVLSTKGNQVRLGIDAPSNVKVDREELHRLKKENNKTSVDGNK